MTPNRKLIAAFDDLISEKDLIAKTGYSRHRLWVLRKQGKVMWFSANGKKIMYSKTSVAQLLNLQVA